MRVLHCLRPWRACSRFRGIDHPEIKMALTFHWNEDKSPASLLQIFCASLFLKLAHRKQRRG